MELIRLLLLRDETDEEPEPEGLSEYSVDEQCYNAALLIDAGFAIGDVEIAPDGRIACVSINRLTWAGHDFLDSMRDPSIWQKAKEKIIRPGVSWTFSLLLDYLKSEAKLQMEKTFGIKL